MWRVKTHTLKCWPLYFSEILSGQKTFDLRYDDRGYQVGDRLQLQEYLRPMGDDRVGTYTGRELTVDVSYILRGPQTKFGLMAGFVCMALAPTRVLHNTKESSTSNAEGMSV